MDGPFQEWHEEGPGLLESIRRYRWLVAAVVLLGALAAYAWSTTQPVRYAGTVRVFLDIAREESDPGRIVRSQAEFLRSPVVLDRTLDLIGDRLTRKELEKRLTVEELVEGMKTKDMDFTPVPANVAKMLDFMHQVGLIKTKAASWKDLYLPEAHDLPGT